MNKIVWGILLLVISHSSFAQKSLRTSRQSSYYTYIYPVNEAVVRDMYAGKRLDENVLKAPVDSFLTAKEQQPDLAPGNYLAVYAEKNNLRYRLIENRSARLKLLDNHQDLQFVLVDGSGNEIRDASVSVNGKPVEYDAAAGLWHAGYPREEESLVKVLYKGIANFTEISFDKDKTKSPSAFKKWLQRSALVKYIYHPFVRLYYKLDDKPLPYKYRRYQVKNRIKKGDFSGYMVFNKPMYKPLDTVKFKAFILKGKSHNPAAEPLDIRLLSYGEKQYLGLVKPANRGSYDFSFLLHDSLKLKLDRNYVVQLYHKDQIYRSGSFRYEDYELKSVTFAVRGDKQEHSRMVPLSLYFKATDENGLNVMDGRAELTVLTNSVSSFSKEKVFVPDTLWKHRFQLDPLGETKLILPDSIFPAADLKYTVKASFFNSNNEEKRAEASFYFSSEDENELQFDVKQDSLFVSFVKELNKSPITAQISAINADSDTLETFKLRIPGTVKISPFAREYEVQSDSLLEWFETEDVKADLSASALRTADSLFIRVDNPHKIPFWYTVLKGNKIVDRGHAIDLNYRKSCNANGTVVFKYNYIWADKSFSHQIPVQFAEKQLNLDVKQPLVVSPGERAEIEVAVTDAKGKAVEDVDLTAWSFTSKFKYNSPPIPYFGKSKQSFRQKPDLDADEGINERTVALNWERWGHELGLDSIEYFRFTHPEPVYRHEEPAPHGLTQISPFITDKGQILPVEILYLNGKPAYFSQAEQVQRYSFKVEPGLVSVGFRLKDKLVSVGSVLVPEGKKLVVSYNIDSADNKTLKVSSQPTLLSNYESSVLNKYMIRVDDTYSPRFAMINQPDKVYLLEPSGYTRWYKLQPKLVGPLSYNLVEFQIKGNAPVSFTADPGFLYTFEPGLIRQKSLQDAPFNRTLGASGPPEFKDYVLTNSEIDSLWLEYLDLRSHTTPLFTNAYLSAKGNGKLDIKINTAAKNQVLPLVKNVLVYRYDNPDFLNIYPGRQTDLGYFTPGNYRLMLLLKGNEFVLVEDVIIKPDGRNLLAISLEKRAAADSISNKISAFIIERAIALEEGERPEAEKIKETFNSRYTNASGYKKLMAGVVYDAYKLPIPGASVRVKGTNFGVVTDGSGRFIINVPEKGKLVVSFIGFEPLEMNINHFPGNVFYLEESKMALQEVVVVGYGAQKKIDYVGAISGKVLGLSVGEASLMNLLSIRGTSSTGDGKPMYIVDGVPMQDALKTLKPEEIAEISVLKDASAVAIYGARAANGVIIITTQKGKEKAIAEAAERAGSDGLSIRKNFSDYAFWQPQLRTDAEGKARFNVTFPDDITNWRTFFIAMNGKEQSGYAENSIKAFKPLSAGLVSPAFAISGDTFTPLGKVMNYTADPVTINRTFSYNGKNILSGSLSVKNAYIDTFKVVAEGTDSVKFQYSIEKQSGYSDGEERSIPLFRAGVSETVAQFYALDKDTAVSLSFDPRLGDVTFRAEASLLPVLMEETERLRNYEYLCNEQVASKLKALLAQKRIREYLNEPFENDKAVKYLIKKLGEGRRSEGTWGWWKNSEGELWISRHAIEAYLDAEKAGYKVSLDKQQMIDYLVYQLSDYKGMNKLDALLLLNRMDAKVDYKTPLALYEKELKSSKAKLTVYDKFKLIRLKQQVGLPVTIDSLVTYRHATMFGNMYFGENSFRFFDNSIQNSLLAYQIIKAEGKHPEWLSKIRNFLLEQRLDGCWRNTYESALILETLLPDVLKEGKKPLPASLTITAASKELVDKFPYAATLDAGTKLQVQKQGDLPVYITAYQQYWNARPGKISKDFTVDTWFENNAGAKMNVLKGGQPAILKAEVIVSADADFVMIEIPVPAGCSYDEKEQRWWGNEVHREYFKNKVSIFCRKLKEGKYSFSVKLMPRYDGIYTLNPAKAEMMYFPVFYGREELKKVQIGD